MGNRGKLQPGTYSAYSLIQINAVPVVTYVGGISGTAHLLKKEAGQTG